MNRGDGRWWLLVRGVAIALVCVWLGCGGRDPGAGDGGGAEDDASLDGASIDGDAPEEDAAGDAAVDPDGATDAAVSHHCDECEEGCDVGLTVDGGSIQCCTYSACYIHAEVCNVGNKNAANAGQVVRFESGDDETHLCDASTSTLLHPGECVTVSCVVHSAHHVRVSVNPDKPECGDAEGRTDEFIAVHCD
jgi:hypothetical protein